MLVARRKVQQYKMFGVKTERKMLFENLKLKWQKKITINRTSHSGLKLSNLGLRAMAGFCEHGHEFGIT